MLLFITITFIIIIISSSSSSMTISSSINTLLELVLPRLLAPTTPLKLRCGGRKIEKTLSALSISIYIYIHMYIYIYIYIHTLYVCINC